MTSSRRLLRDQIIRLLDLEARADFRNKTSVKVNHYTLKTVSGFDLRLMLQIYEHPKNGSLEPPVMWVLERAVSALNLEKFDAKRSPRSRLFRETGANGRKRYGRHSGLKTVPQLAEADLVRFTPRTYAEAETIVAALKLYSP